MRIPTTAQIRQRQNEAISILKEVKDSPTDATVLVLISAMV
jgi:hypothetical protein